MPSVDQYLINVGDHAFRRRVKIVLDWLQVQDQDQVLDLGCGEGFYIMLLAELTRAHVDGIDSDAKLLENARRWIGEKPNVSLYLQDALRTPFADNSYDKAICSEVLEHIEDDQAVAAELYRVLRPGGLAAITVPYCNYPLLFDPLNWVRENLGLGHFNPANTVLGGVWSYRHVRLYSVGGIQEVLRRAGFTIEELKPILHYCVPFYYHLLRIGKLLQSSGILPATVASSMEKFAWKEANSKSPKATFNPARWAQKILDYVDHWNDQFSNPSKSFVSIAVKVRKPL